MFQEKASLAFSDISLSLSRVLNRTAVFKTHDQDLLIDLMLTQIDVIDLELRHLEVQLILEAGPKQQTHKRLLDTPKQSSH